MNILYHINVSPWTFSHFIPSPIQHCYSESLLRIKTLFPFHVSSIEGCSSVPQAASKKCRKFFYLWTFFWPSTFFWSKKTPLPGFSIDNDQNNSLTWEEVNVLQIVKELLVDVDKFSLLFIIGLGIPESQSILNYLLKPISIYGSHDLSVSSMQGNLTPKKKSLSGSWLSSYSGIYCDIFGSSFTYRSLTSWMKLLKDKIFFTDS